MSRRPLPPPALSLCGGSAANESLRAAEASNRALEERGAKMESQLSEMQLANLSLTATANAASDKAEESRQRRDVLQASKDAVDAALLSLREERSQLQSQLSEAEMRNQTLEETSRLSETKLTQERDLMYEQMVKLQAYVSTAMMSRPPAVLSGETTGEPSSAGGAPSSVPGSAAAATRGGSTMQRSPTVPLPDLLSSPGLS